MFHTNNPKKQFVKFETEKYEDNHCREIIITCDNFSAKYYPQGWRFFPKTGGLTLLSVQSRSYLCAQNENDCLMRPTERRENGGKRKWRQIRQENFKGEIREKKKPKRKRNIAGNMKPANHLQGSMVYLSVQTRLVGRINHSSQFACRGDGLCHSWASGHIQLSAYGSKEPQKEKSIENP
ncbi:MAG: hypothetical protein ACLSG8_11595 [Barnesiella sp.]